MRKKLLAGLIVTLAAVAAGCNRKPQEVTAASTSASAPTLAPNQATQAPPTGANPEPVAPSAGGNPEPVAPSAGGNPEPMASPAPGAPLPPAGANPGPAPTGPAPVAGLDIPSGTRIRVRLGQSLDTKFNRPGEHFVAYLDEPVVDGYRVVLPKGTEFDGHVTEAKRSGRLKGRAYLGLRLDSFQLQGVRYEIRTNNDVARSGNHKRRNIALIGGGAGAGASIGAIAGGGPGALIGAGAGAVAGTTGAIITGRKNVHLQVESVLRFSLEGGVFVRS
jgi:hypothetical protein